MSTIEPLVERPLSVPAYAPPCLHCGQDVPVGTRFCSGCGAPVDNDEYDVLIAPDLKKAHTTMLALAALYAFAGLLGGALQWEDTRVVAGSIIVINLALAALHLSLGKWARRAPFAASLVALALYVTVHVMDAIGDPASLWNGIVIKVIVIAALVRSIKAGLAVRRIKAETLGAPTG